MTAEERSRTTGHARAIHSLWRKPFHVVWTDAKAANRLETGKLKLLTRQMAAGTAAGFYLAA